MYVYVWFLRKSYNYPIYCRANERGTLWMRRFNMMPDQCPHLMFVWNKLFNLSYLMRCREDLIWKVIQLITSASKKSWCIQTRCFNPSKLIHFICFFKRIMMLSYVHIWYIIVLYSISTYVFAFNWMSKRKYLKHQTNFSPKFIHPWKLIMQTGHIWLIKL